MRYILAQIFGFSAMGLMIATYQFKRHRTLMLLMVICSGLWCAHYASLGLFTPVIMNVINVARGIVYSFREKKWVQTWLIPAAFLIISSVAVFLTWENVWSLLPFAASVSATLANWQKDTRKLKILTLPVCLCWFFYNMINRSIAGMANEAFTLTSIIVALLRQKNSSRKEEIPSGGEC